MCYPYKYIGGIMEITFKEIGAWFSANKLYFLIPLDIIITILFICLIIRWCKIRRRKSERKRQNKLHRTSKKAHKL